PRLFTLFAGRLPPVALFPYPTLFRSVFVLILAGFGVPKAYQQRALMIGIVLALIFRGVFILAGAALIERFVWIFFIFGAWLIWTDRKSTRLNSSHVKNSYAVFCLKKK